MRKSVNPNYKFETTQANYNLLKIRNDENQIHHPYSFDNIAYKC